jgi:Rod binding domain-containing protein
VSRVAPLPAPDSAPLESTAAWSSQLDSAQADSQARGIGADASAAKAQAGQGLDPKQIDKLRKVSQDFESVFLSYMMKVGRDTSMKGTFMGHTQGEEIFTEMRDDELAKHMASAGGIGLAKLLVEQLTRTLQQQAIRQNPGVDA